MTGTCPDNYITQELLCFGHLESCRIYYTQKTSVPDLHPPLLAHVHPNAQNLSPTSEIECDDVWIWGSFNLTTIRVQPWFCADSAFEKNLAWTTHNLRMSPELLPLNATPQTLRPRNPKVLLAAPHLEALSPLNSLQTNPKG